MSVLPNGPSPSLGRPPPSCARRRRWPEEASRRWQPCWSIQLLFVEDVAERLATQVAAQVVAEDLGDARVLLRDRARGMRTDDHIRHVPERRVLRRRLFTEHVEGRTSKPFLLERTDQRVLVDQGAAADVDQNGAWLQKGKLGLADDPLAVRRMWRREHKEVGLPQHRVQ